jgi:hypothetical protein
VKIQQLMRKGKPGINQGVYIRTNWTLSVLGSSLETSWVSLRNLGSNQGVYIRARGPVCKKEKHSGTKLNIII